MPHEFFQMAMLHFVEERPDVQIHDIVHLLAGDPDIERIQCIMLASPRPESVRKAQKVLFPDLVENLHHRGLGDFVFQRRDPQWPLPAIVFGDPNSP
jgi:hypothetical protein